MGKTNIYDVQNKAFSNVSAFAICKITDTGGGNFGDIVKVATVQLKFPKDGAGRLWCYFHLIGLEMVRAYAGGYGYDKRSAAIKHAIDACVKQNNMEQLYDSNIADLNEIAKLCEKIDVYGLNHCLHGTQYKLIQAV